MSKRPSSYTNPDLTYERHSDDGLVHAVCKRPIDEGSIICYEIPARGTSTNFKLDVLRYTMQCVYSGECLFPCAFNQEPPDDMAKVFFDYAFQTEFRRRATEKLALALYAHNKVNTPFLFKTLGVFTAPDHQPNCLRVAFPNGETFLVAERSIDPGEILAMSPRSITIPTQETPDNPSATLDLLCNIDLCDAHAFTKALSYRTSARQVRPAGRVCSVNSQLDPGLEKRLAKYKIDREMGIADFHVSMNRLGRAKSEADSLNVSDLFDTLYEKFDHETAQTKVSSETARTTAPPPQSLSGETPSSAGATGACA